MRCGIYGVLLAAAFLMSAPVVSISGEAEAAPRCKSEKNAVKAAKRNLRNARKEARAPRKELSTAVKRLDVANRKFDRKDNQTNRRCERVSLQGERRVEKAERRILRIAAQQTKFAAKLVTCLFQGNNCQGIENKIAKLASDLILWEARKQDAETNADTNNAICQNDRQAAMSQAQSDVDRAVDRQAAAEGPAAAAEANIAEKEGLLADREAELQACLAA